MVGDNCAMRLHLVDAARLQERRAEAALYKRLATLVDDVPLIESLDDLRWRGAPKARFERMARSLGGVPFRPRQWRDDP